MASSSKSNSTPLTGQAAREQFEPSTVSIMPDEQVTRVTLLRHGEVESFEKRVVRGQLDAELSSRGFEQSRIVADWCVHALPRPDVLFSSDLKRCRYFASVLGEKLSLEPQYEPRLREQSMGSWQGRTWDEISAEDGAKVTAYWDNYVETTPPEGECLLDLQQRIQKWWNEMHASHAGKRIVIVTHIGVIRSLLCSLLDIPLHDALRFAPAVGSYTSLLISNSGAVVESIGERPWAWSENLIARAAIDNSNPRIALSGSAGTGKTTLGRELAKRLGVPFIEEGMRARLEAGLDIHSLDMNGFRELLRDLWNEQQVAESAASSGFVVDRSSLDYSAFWLHYNLWEAQAETDTFFDQMQSAASNYDRILLFPWGALPIEADGVRATNPWLQLRYQTILEGILDRYVKDELITRVPAVDDFEVRLAETLSALGG
ncbi:MAG: alpha-ribazole phosphatase [Planctomycetota bacterium]|jgi:alpha-ribazole phosphatase